MQKIMLLLFDFQIMKRTRRHKFIQISVYFLVYFIFYVYSENIEKDTKDLIKNVVPQKAKNKSTIIVTTTTVSTTTNVAATSPPKTTVETKPIKKAVLEVHATLRPKRNDCTPPAIEQVIYYTY